MCTQRRVVTSVLIMAALSGTCLVLISSALRTSYIFAVGDEAMTEIYTRAAMQGRQTLGPYSRFGWHHPGPTYFYLLAPFYATAGQLTAGLNAGALGINVLMVAVTGWLLVRSRAYALLLSFAVMGSLYFSRFGDLLASSWNPHAALLPSIAGLVAAGTFLAGDRAGGPIAVALASYGAQTHIAVLPLLGVTLLATLVSPVVFANTWDRMAPQRGHSLLHIALALIALWWLPLFEATVNRGGNAWLLATSFQWPGLSEQEPQLALSAWSSMLAWVWPGGLRVPIGAPFSYSPGTITTVVAVGEIAGLVAVALWSWRGRRRFQFWLASLALVSSIVALAATMHVPENLTDHQVFWISGIGLLNATVIGSVFVTALNPAGIVPERWARVLSAALAMALIGLALHGGLIAMRHVGVRSRHPSWDERFVRAAFASLHRVVPERRTHRVLVRMHPATWEVSAGLLLQLQKNDIPAAVDADLVRMYGEGFRPTGKENLEAVIVTADQRGSLLSGGNNILTLDDGRFVMVVRPLPRASTPFRSPLGKTR